MDSLAFGLIMVSVLCFGLGRKVVDECDDVLLTTGVVVI